MRLSPFKKVLPHLAIFVLVSCTGETARNISIPGGSYQVDIDDGIQGLSERAFYATSSSSSASVILTVGKGSPARLIKVSGSKMSLFDETISPADLEFSADENLLLVKGKSEIFEYSATKLDQVFAAESQLPAPKVESYCKGLVGFSFNELVIEVGANGYDFMGLSSGGRQQMGGSGAVNPIETASGMEFEKSGFGSLKIDRSLPSSVDSLFHKTTLSMGVPSPLSNQVSLYCRSNPIPIGQ